MIASGTTGVTRLPEQLRALISSRQQTESASRDRGRRLGAEVGEAGAQVFAELPGVPGFHAEHRTSLREWVLAVAKELVKRDPDSKEVGRHVPSGEVRIGWLIGRGAEPCVPGRRPAKRC